MTKYIKLKPTAKQTAFLLLDCLDAFYGGAGGGGKSIALLMAALQYVDIPGYNALILRNTYKNLTKAEGLITVSHEWLHNTDAHWSGEKNKWTFPSGATLEFGHLEGPNDHFNYDSAAYQYTAIDELTSIRENQARYMFTRLRRTKKLKNIPLRVRSASNPPRREQVAKGAWVKRRYVDEKTRGDRIFIRAWMTDNPFLDQEAYRMSLSNLDEVTRLQIEEGDWNVQAKGTIFDRGNFHIVDHRPVQAYRVRYWDLAATEVSKENKKPARTAGVKMAITSDKRIFIEDVVKFQKNPPGTEKMIKQTAQLDGKEVEIYMEQEGGSGGKNTISHYRRNVLFGYAFSGNTVSGKGNKLQRANPFSTQVEAGNVFLVNGPWVEEYLQEAEVFPDGEYLDQIDATSGAYEVMAGTGIKPRIRVIY